jgi:uncharacterized phage infection (PIP) family protein YhgE
MNNTINNGWAYSGVWIAVAALLCVSADNANGQLGGLKKLGFGKDKGKSVKVDKGAFGDTLNDVLGKVTSARIAFLDAQEKLGEAVGLKKEVRIKISEAKRALEGASSDPGKLVKSLKDSTKTSKSANKELKKAMNSSGELSADSKTLFAKGTAKFVEGVLLEKDQIETIKTLVDQGKQLTTSANPFEKLKVIKMIVPVTTLAILVPGDIKEAVTTLRGITAFAKKQNVKLDSQKKADNLLGGLE